MEPPGKRQEQWLVGPKRRRALVAVVYLLGLVCLLEGTTRLYWKWGHDVDFFDSEQILFVFYPEIRRLVHRPISQDDGELDILLLGGSVLSNHYGNISHLLGERLTRVLRRPVNVHNVSRTAHTSLDSLSKYRALSEQRFDLVIFYHGINEARANNCPDDVFRDDYSHFAWYERVQGLHRHREIRWLTFPYTLAYLLQSVEEASGDSDHISPGKPREGWTRYGADVKTVGPFAHNLASILLLAQERGEPVLVPSFAYYLAPDYSRRAFDRKQLDYSLHAFPVELWGEPGHVVRAIEAHNDMGRRIATSASHALWIDLESQIEKNGDHFNDICHLTGLGCMRFADHVVPAVLAMLGRRGEQATARPGDPGAADEDSGV